MRVSYLPLLLIFAVDNCFAINEYIVTSTHNAEHFIINENNFKAQTYCPFLKIGDRVRFLAGNPNSCTFADVLDLNSKRICRLWCEP